MKDLLFSCLACIAVLSTAGCSPVKEAAGPTSETRSGTFASAEGDAVTALYSKHATVRLLLPDKRQVELYLAISGSGARYTNGTAEWWEHQGEATYSVGGSNLFRGKIVASR